MIITDLKLLYRDWRGGQLSLVITALVLAVMVVTAVSLFADRVERGLNAQITSFLASDLAVRSGIPIGDDFRNQAEQLNLATADIALFRSMVFAGDANHLASVKVVSQAYPLRGVIELSADLQGAQLLQQQTGPDKGEAWIEPRLFNLLGIQLGDQIEVGYATLTVTRVIVNEPDRGTGFSGTGARVMMSQEDLAESQLVRPGSRIGYRLLLAGTATNVEAYQRWFDSSQEARTEEAHHYSLVTPQNAEEQLSEALERGRGFLLLSGTIGVLLAGLAVALASQRYADRLSDQVALMKAWGSSARAVRRSQFVRLLTIACISTLIGMLLGWLSHSFLLELARGLLQIELPAPGVRPWLTASLTGVVCVLGFALPALWHLPGIAPLRVLRRDLPTGLVGSGKRWVIGISALLLLAFWYSQSIIIASLFLIALFALFGICALVAMQFLRVVKSLGAWQGSYARLGLANLWRRRGQTLIQLVGFSATLMLLLIVTGMRTNLIAEWEAQLPDDTPTHFVFNVANQEVEPIQALLKEENLTTTQWFPMVRGRLVSINNEEVSEERMARSDGLQREVNLTQSATMPVGNTLVAGDWWQEAPEQFEFSIEQDVAEEIGLNIGDFVGFSIGGLKFEARLRSIRAVDWQSMNPNFYIVFYPGALDAYSPNWVTAVRAPEPDGESLVQQAPFVAKMVQAYPTAVVLELGDVIERIRDLISRVTQGLEMILLLVLACGAMVLFAAIGVSYDERLRENAILRTLGSPRKMVLGALTVEYASLGAIAGLIAGLGAELVLYFVQRDVFQLEPQLHPSLWLIGLAGGTLLITVLGLWRSREIISVPPLQSLRQLA